MNPNDRFYGCESLGFPAVSNYDFNENIPNRGIEDRNFRWEEVAAPTLYMLKEATVSGSFEDNTFSYSNPTGVNYITSTGPSTNSVDYPFWNIKGNRTLWIGKSGIFVYSGNIPGVTGFFQCHPIDGDEAIGLFCSETGLTSSPTIYSNNISIGSEGPMIIEGKHQLYLQAKLNYGNTGLLKAYVRGWNGGSVVAYYNPFNSSWEASAPTGNFIVNNNITTIKYDFTCINFPAATPTSFDVYVTNTNSGSFVTVDNIHLDTYFKKNAFLDYIVPTGYMIQITPDLGWHNIMDLFDSSETIVNPYIKTLGPYEIDLGNLSDNLDNSVTATLDYSDFISATSDTYKKYLWRAVALTPNGQLGAGGFPQRFFYVGDEVNKSFSVDDIIQDDFSSSKVIIGKKSKTMVILVDGQENNPGLSYPTATSWRLEILLSSASRTIVIRGRDAGGSLSSFKKITLTNKLFEQNDIAVWNVFDEHGLVADIERLPGEGNFEFSNRIKDAYANRGGSTFIGIVNGATRELNLSKVPDAIIFSINRDEFNNPIVPSIAVDVTSYSLRVISSSFVKEEKLLVDPIFNTVELSYFPVDLPEHCELDGVGKINAYKIEKVEDDNKSKYYLKINHDLAAGKFVTVKYNYAREILFKNYLTIESVINYLNSITTEYNRKIFTARISEKLSGNENSMGLALASFTVSADLENVIGWTPIVLKKMSDRGYRDYFIKEDLSTLKNTKYYSFVEEIKKATKIFWGTVEADRSVWDAADSKDLAMDSIPTLFDPPLSKITSVYTGKEVFLEPVEAWGRNYIGYNNEYLSNVGITQDLFHPGVAHRTDLEPTFYFTTSKIQGLSGMSYNIGPARNFNNTVLLFSGQR